jgi:hypothetical protein
LFVFCLSQDGDVVQVFFTVGREYGTKDKSEALGYVNQSGLSRKVMDY